MSETGSFKFIWLRSHDTALYMSERETSTGIQVSLFMDLQVQPGSIQMSRLPRRHQRILHLSARLRESDGTRRGSNGRKDARSLLWRSRHSHDQLIAKFYLSDFIKTFKVDQLISTDLLFISGRRVVFAAADGDACLNQGRTSLLKCMYKALPTLKHISSNQMGVNSTLPIGPTCK